MKAKLILLAAVVIAGASCKNDNERYLNLNTGENVELERDSTTGFMIDADSHQPVDLYVDTKTNDTIYGRTGKVINGYVVKDDKGVYAYRDWEVKVDGEEYKSKSRDAKIKSEDGHSKVKDGSYTKKVDEDGDIKIENGTTTTKIDGKTGKKKVKKDQNITDKVKKVFD